MNSKRGGRSAAPGGLLARVRRYIADLDAASLETLRHDGELRELAKAERGEREAELRDEAEVFAVRLPAWLRRDAGEPGSSWVAAADIVLRRRRSRPPFAMRVGRSRAGMTLPRGSQLRLVGSHSSGVSPTAPGASATVADAPASVPAIGAVADPGRAVHPEHRTFEVVGGPLAGMLIDVAARPADGVRRHALTAAAMVAPAGERIAEVPAAADSVLRQLEECRRKADHAEAVLRHQHRWAWAHSVARPRQLAGRVERVDVRVEKVEVHVETADRRATGGEDRLPRP